MEKFNKPKTGLFKLGFVENKDTYLENLQKLLLGTDAVADSNNIRSTIEDGDIEYINGAGYSQFPNGDIVNVKTAKYVRFKTSYSNVSGVEIYGWFTRSKTSNASFTGVEWGTDEDFKRVVKRSNTFQIGDYIYFDSYEDGLEFLEDLASKIIPESWKYKRRASAINHPILKSYIENIYGRLRKEAEEGAEDKIVYSSDRKYAMFNTNLLDKYFHDVIIAAEIDGFGNGESLRNPFIVKSMSERLKLKMPRETDPKQPSFFNNVNDVVFDPKWIIDKDFDTFTHIIDERRARFAEKYSDASSDELAQRLDQAIDSAVIVAQRNYKFIVPMYRPQKNCIQLLMPIYLSGSLNDTPDFALVLTPDSENKMYIPETILPLDAVYQNARLIAKPDESWLNPDTIK